ncbi:MAG TPA: hypothetical protein VNQ80_17775 [Parapedobacter sp.]|uniref:DUF6934 family protein n=1 Tax=Parapedobacter sp. TaxID=1958893 RepID=UPI002B5CF9BF|nr:hypothetical protein [Parapedobacter sp.]HWK59197.1 hypothetical protein [Parapedobacter sp.]
MKYPKYDYVAESQLMHFEFTSIGPKGEIKKIVEYSETSLTNVFNIAFGDYDENVGGINDKIVTNNGDSEKVLATVASTVYPFTGRYPDSWIYATGSTGVRTRLYLMGLTNNLTEIAEDFYVYGLKNEKWEEFVSGEDYEAFLATRKNRNFVI